MTPARSTAQTNRSSPGRFRIVEDDLTGPEICVLLRMHLEEMSASSPAEACHVLDLDGLRRPDVTMWSVWDGDELAGCGALREIDATHGEIKSMRTHPAHLGRGVGRLVLEHVTEQARSRGFRRLSLETGSGAAFAAAIRLYESAGFEACGPFGDYRAHEFSRFMTREIAAPSSRRG